MEGDRISYHESVRMVYERLKEDSVDNIWDRYEAQGMGCLLYTSPSPRDVEESRMPSSA